MFRAKIKAALAHGMLTLLVGLVLSALVFGLWYPGVFSQIMPGIKLFILILAVELVLGPVMSLIIYNPKKRRRELIIDYCVILAIQLSALIYGVFNVASSRPAYVVFVKDRFEVVAATEVHQASQENSKLFRSLPWFGPKLVCTRLVVDAKERERLLFDEYTKGRDVQHLPEFYRDCTDGEIYQHAFPLEKLLSVINFKEANHLFGEELNSNVLRWLPIHGRRGVWVALIEKGKNQAVKYVEFDPY